MSTSPLPPTDPSQLLATKFYIPPPRGDWVPRPRLAVRLDEGLAPGCVLTLVSAPAGFGKTTLVGAWLDGADVPCAWLSLEEGDNDPVRFAAYLIAALQRVDSQIGRGARAMLQTPRPPPSEAWLTRLINEIAEAPHTFVLVLDDYQSIHTLAIHQMLAFLLDHAPAPMHLVLISREDPPLPLPRLRARGRMVEIRQADLQFTLAETSEFLGRTMRLTLPTEAVAALQHRTEGWVAGLQLAALSLRDRDDAPALIDAFTGSPRYVLDYLMEEVFAAQPAAVRDFLLRVSVLDRLTAPLCDAVAGCGDSRARLDDLERRSLFIAPLDGSRRWYRFHPLFGELLRQRRRLSEGGEGASDLHRRASRWYAARGLTAEAIQHALAGEDWARAVSMIRSVSTALLQRGEMLTLLRWYGALPEAVVFADPRLSLERSWPLILTEQIEAAEPYVDAAAEMAQTADDSTLEGSVAAARAHIARLKGDHAGVIALSERALSLLPRDDAGARSVVAVNLGLTRWFSGRLAEAERALAEARRTGRESGNAYAEWAAATFLGRIQVARGRLHQGAALCRRMIERGGEASIVCLAHFDLGRLLYEWNALDAALEHLEEGLALARQGGSVEFEAGGCGTRAVIEQALGDEDAARASLRRAEALLANPGISPSTRLAVLASRIAVALALGDVDSAEVAASRIPPLEGAGSFPDMLRLMGLRARLFLARGERSAAAECLDLLRRRASARGWESASIRARALQALAARIPAEAHGYLLEALGLAEPEGYIRTFVDAGAPMAALLREAAGLGVLPGYVSRLLAAFGAEAAPYRTRRSPVEPLIEPLSARELEVLALLGEGLTNQEIAARLVVSLNTVKTHLKHIYGKLAVHTRSEAVIRGRVLGLLSYD